MVPGMGAFSSFTRLRLALTFFVRKNWKRAQKLDAICIGGFPRWETDEERAHRCAAPRAGRGLLKACYFHVILTVTSGNSHYILRFNPRALPTVHLEGGDKGRLRDLDVADLAHALLALLLLLEELLLAADVAAVALGQHVLAQRADGLARDHPAADRRLDGDLEKLARGQVLQALAQGPAAAFGGVLVDDHGERIDRLVVDQDVELSPIPLLVARHPAIEA